MEVNMSISEAFLAELAHESVATRKTLERIPEGGLDFKPHDKSMPMGRLATHVAEIAAWGAIILEQDVFDMDPENYKPFQASNPGEVVTLFDRNLAALTDALKGVPDARMAAVWKMTVKGQLMIEMPRNAVFRNWVLNHLVHHRAQLGVYLRLLGVPVPAVYGPSADESPA